MMGCLVVPTLRSSGCTACERPDVGLATAESRRRELTGVASSELAVELSSVSACAFFWRGRYRHQEAWEFLLYERCFLIERVLDACCGCK